MNKSKSDNHLDKILKDTFKDVSFPHKYLNGHLTILKNYTKNGKVSGLNDFDYLDNLDNLNKTI